MRPDLYLDSQFGKQIFLGGNSTMNEKTYITQEEGKLLKFAP